ncbi:hypothetical protein SERLADRAFT_416034 [Serpula lacrymans var. lacrymans S7.9]|uniref:Uncharacterized protein n=1 Tax=Serpula lacrymans var. lacrymans (strain S7.9) TaxID=578457 RepID=F8NYF5_SERL9|nr:uncharacterized protein SERLADRAFT_416034 [Serpula lacrymans var. lacrymans S7.9]EGO23626.1 hypothetical protein SERLADRAFT_416034 [Serpula lacrymans var. lacrymans S7.9]
MPSFSCHSFVRAASEEHKLTLRICHNLVHNDPSETVYKIKGRLPKELDVLLSSNLTFSFDGLSQGKKVPKDILARSIIVVYLRNYLRAARKFSLCRNSAQLGLCTVSDPYVDEDGITKFDLLYIWKAKQPTYKDSPNSAAFLDAASPFSSQIFLPIESILHRVTGQFVTYHLVSRYPLIFGPWCKNADVFYGTFFHASAATLLACHGQFDTVIDNNEKLKYTLDHSYSDQEALRMSMERIYKNGVPCPRFKPVVPIPGLVPTDTSEDGSFDLSQDSSYEKDLLDTSFHYEILDLEHCPTPQVGFYEEPIDLQYQSMGFWTTETVENVLRDDKNETIPDISLINDPSSSVYCTLPLRGSPLAASDEGFQYSNLASNPSCSSQSWGHDTLEDAGNWTSNASSLTQGSHHLTYPRTPSPSNVTGLFTSEVQEGILLGLDSPIDNCLTEDSDSDSDLLIDSDDMSPPYSLADCQNCSLGHRLSCSCRSPDVPLGMYDTTRTAASPFSDSHSNANTFFQGLERGNTPGEGYSVEFLDFDIEL